jgi:hypothetical protein
MRGRRQPRALLLPAIARSAVGNDRFFDRKTAIDGRIMQKNPSYANAIRQISRLLLEIRLICTSFYCRSLLDGGRSLLYNDMVI